MYRRALEALELEGSQCVFVDDHAKNLRPAEALGTGAIHHTTDSRRRPQCSTSYSWTAPRPDNQPSRQLSTTGVVCVTSPPGRVSYR
ncbi:HAD-IA family hydrolase [Streptomyces violaceusniger]|uniref:HAD-IA family hydrolase n=1 Tax=Streptomyces violaceusniger TaxID=68280 RepID=UPI00382FAC8E